MTQPTAISGRNRLHLSGLPEQTAAMVAKLGTELDHYRCKLNELNSRYAEGRFHLAVLGQFKRVKNTLLNASNFLQKYAEIPVFFVSDRKSLDARTDKDLQNRTSSGSEQLESFRRRPIAPTHEGTQV